MIIPRLDISFSLRRQWSYWFGKEYNPIEGEFLLNHARTGIVMALRVALPKGGRVGVVAYNCHTVANAVANAMCTPVFVDVTDGLTIDIQSVPKDLDAIVVTNLFGIRNDIDAIRKRCQKAIIIVDNAHGYGLPIEGDYTVYSINQGKFPALGSGGILYVNKNMDKHRCAAINIDHPQKTPKTAMQCVDEMYEVLPKYGFVAQSMLFFSMLIKAIAYSRCVYGLTMRMKKSSKPKVHEQVVMKQMALGISRLYRAALPEIGNQIAEQRKNAETMKSSLIGDCKLQIDDFIMGENAFMLIAKTQDPAALKAWFMKRGVETETHFAHAVDWAKEFGYVSGSCPNAERLTKELLMIPTYYKI